MYGREKIPIKFQALTAPYTYLCLIRDISTATGVWRSATHGADGYFSVWEFSYWHSFLKIVSSLTIKAANHNFTWTYNMNYQNWIELEKKEFDLVCKLFKKLFKNTARFSWHNWWNINFTNISNEHICRTKD